MQLPSTTTDEDRIWSVNFVHLWLNSKAFKLDRCTNYRGCGQIFTFERKNKRMEAWVDECSRKQAKSCLVKPLRGFCWHAA